MEISLTKRCRQWHTLCRPARFLSFVSLSCAFTSMHGLLDVMPPLPAVLGHTRHMLSPSCLKHAICACALALPLTSMLTPSDLPRHLVPCATQCPYCLASACSMLRPLRGNHASPAIDSAQSIDCADRRGWKVEKPRWSRPEGTGGKVEDEGPKLERVRFRPGSLCKGMRRYHGSVY